uniref:Serpentine Receptor, class T n=1 Tax=Steinernema glaseri TaxID=37863 RepID=A0A1I7ZRZ6_9BILA
MLASYIGQYGVVLASTDYFLSTLVYFVLLLKKNKAVKYFLKSGGMWAGIVIAELIFSIILSFPIIIMFVILLVKGKLYNTMKDSPPLVLVLVANFLSAMLFIGGNIEWFLIIGGLIPNIGQNTLWFIVPGFTGNALAGFYELANAALFAQRTFILLFPFKPMRRASKMIASVAILLFLLAAFTIYFENLKHLLIFDRPIPEGCYGFTCVRRWLGGSIFIVKVIIAIIMFLFGVIFLIVFRISKKVQNDTKYMFLLHASCTVVMQVTDYILAMAGIMLGNYIGQYGLVMASSEYFLSTLVYFILLTKKAKTVKVSVSVSQSASRVKTGAPIQREPIFDFAYPAVLQSIQVLE